MRSTSRRIWRRLLPAMLAGLASVGAISCGGSGGGGKTQTSSSGLILNKSTLDFGSVPVGTSKSSSLTLSNSSSSGGANVTISEISVAGAAFGASFPNLPLILAPGQSSTITATFQPQSDGGASGTLIITVDGAGAVSVPLTGTGVSSGQLSVAPAALSFGDVAVGSKKSLGGTLTAGSSSITVTSADWSGQGYSVSDITFPLTVPAGQSVSFTINFAPEVVGASSGSVGFASDASNSPASQTFSGTGTQVTQHMVGLTWDPSTDVVVGYNVYRGTRSGGPYSKLNSSPQPGTSYGDSQVEGGATYYYVTTAVDADSNESVFSNQATAHVPTP